MDPVVLSAATIPSSCAGSASISNESGAELDSNFQSRYLCRVKPPLPTALEVMAVEVTGGLTRLLDISWHRYTYYSPS